MSADDIPQIGGLPLPIEGATRLYVILGDPIEQVGSPRVFNTLFSRQGVKAVLVPMHVRPPDLAATMRGLRAIANLDGIIVTVPHKASIVAHIDKVGERAQHIGAVNAIRRDGEGRLVGENFDGEGCVIGLARNGYNVVGRRTLVVGAGGAGSAVAHSLAQAGVRLIQISDVDEGRARALAGAIRHRFPQVATDVGGPDPNSFDLVVNCSPVGMHESDPYPIDPERIAPEALVVDVLLKPRISRLLEAAKRRGCAIQPGYFMLEGQADAIATYFGVAP